MRRLALLASVIGIPASLEAQDVPGRDLFEFPIGSIGEAPALARSVAGGIWNPAAPPLGSEARARASLAAFNTPVEQGVTLYGAGAAFRLPRALTLSVAALRAQVGDIVRTTDAPNTEGDEIPYHTSLLSAGLSGTLRGITVGGALRYRRGTADATHRQSISFDAGFTMQPLPSLPLRIGAGTFLLGAGERTAIQAAAEYSVITDSVRDFRASYSFTGTEGTGFEHYVLGTARYGRVEARAGIVNVIGRLSSAQRLRLGVGLYYARYTVGISREENGAGLGPSYQFALTSTYR